MIDGYSDGRGKLISARPGAVLGLLLLLLIAAGLQLAAELARGRTLGAELDRAHRAHAGIQTISGLLQDAELAHRDRLIAGRAPDAAGVGIGEFAAAVDSLQPLFPRQPEQKARLDRLRSLGEARLDLLEASLALLEQDGDAAAALVSKGAGARVSGELSRTEGELLRAQARAVEAGAKAGLTAKARVEALVAGLFAALLAALCAAVSLTRRQARRRVAQLDGHLARQQAIFDSTLDALITLNPDGRIGSVNRAAETMFGYAGDELRGGDLSLLLDSSAGPGGAGSAAFPSDLRLPPGLSRGVIKELTGYRRDGSSFPADAALSHMPQPDGLHVVAAIRDISERRRVERLKDEFVSTVSHELRTPLTSIAASLGLLAGGAAGAMPDRAGRLLSIASSNCQRLVRLINDVLDIQKIESGELEFEMRPQSLRALTRRALEDLAGYAHELEVDIREVGEEDGLVQGDGDRLLQVLTNLVSNAVKFSPKGGTVEVRLRPTPGGEIRLCVRDQGPGVPEDFHDRIFTKFAQADSSDTRQKGGTGLGLAIAREIVERHGGSLSFESAPGEGAVFFLDLPLAAASSPEARAA